MAFLCMIMIIISYGRVEELVYYAGLKEQYETLIHHFVQVNVIANTHPFLHWYFGYAWIIDVFDGYVKLTSLLSIPA